jgi:glucose-1-phosphate thymidylyltransferase
MNSRFVGVVPAAGRGTRLASLRYPKELLPIVYELVETGGVRPRAVAEYTLEAISAAAVSRLLVIVAPWKLDIINYLGDGRHLGLDIGYLYQEQARGLPYAVDLARPWTRDQHVVFAMPDTIFMPSNALAWLREHYIVNGADLALAVFPTQEAQRLGPVLIRDGRVEAVLDKPDRAPVMNTWGAAIWGDAFADLLHDGLDAASSMSDEPVLGYYFDCAVRHGMRVVAVEFAHGSFEDAGTHTGLLRCLEGVHGPVLCPDAKAAAGRQ